MPVSLTLTPLRGPGEREVRVLATGTLSIGRGSGNNWVLIDPDRHLSKTHCVISIEGSRAILTDLSTNGMYVNGARQATERDSRIVLTDGDEFRLGDYSIAVTEIADLAAGHGASPVNPFGADAYGGDPFGANALGGGVFGSGQAWERQTSGGPLDVDPLDDPLGRGPGGGFAHPPVRTSQPTRPPDPFDVLDENRSRKADEHAEDLFRGSAVHDPWHGATQADNVDGARQAFVAPKLSSSGTVDELDFDALIGDLPLGPTVSGFVPAPPLATPRPNPTVESASGPVETSAVVPAPPAPQPPEISPAIPDPAALIDAFLQGAGVPQIKLHDQSPEAIMRHAGEVFHALVEGLRLVLMSRAAIKNEFRVEQTMLRPRDNNALKFSVSTEEAVAALLGAARAGHKPPLDATREAFADIQSHELAVMAGVQCALLGLLKRFSPETLEGRLQPAMLDVLPANRRARMWELFRATYAEIAREAEDDFQAVFGREFARAYDAQIKSL